MGATHQTINPNDGTTRGRYTGVERSNGHTEETEDARPKRDYQRNVNWITRLAQSITAIHVQRHATPSLHTKEMETDCTEHATTRRI
jgi:hypothetical protein